MGYVALKQMKTGAKGETLRIPGDEVPEALTWRHTQRWVRRRHILHVPDSEIVEGRWTGWGKHAKSLGMPDHLVNPAPAKLAAETPVDPRVALDERTKRELLDEAKELGLKVGQMSSKATIIAAILDAS